MSWAPEQLSPSVWRLPVGTATLPPFDHINTYLMVSNGVAAIVDPGSPEDAAQPAIDALLESTGVRLLKLVLLTHTHPDHVEGLPALLARHPDTPVYVHGAEAAGLDVEAQVVRLGDGRRLTVGDRVVEALHTPGHSPGHLTFVCEAVALVGDLVAGSGSSWVGFPGGDVAAYLNSLERVAALRPALLGPGHGPTVRDPATKLREAAEHRLERERQVLAAMAQGSILLADLRTRLYSDLDPRMHDLAEGSLLAHLAKLMSEMKVMHLGEDEQGPYALRR